MDELHTVSGFSCATTSVPTNSLPKMHRQEKEFYEIRLFPKDSFLADKSHLFIIFQILKTSREPLGVDFPVIVEWRLRWVI